MKRFATAITIHASPETIWSILTDAPRYPTWNPTVVQIDGRIALGEKVTVHAKATPGRAFPLTVAAFEPARRMVWTGGMPLGLFTGTRTFTLMPQPDGGAAFAMREEFSGLLAPLITRSIPDLQPAFDAFAADLKRQAESPSDLSHPASGSFQNAR
jgi:hypothetical protein